MNLEMVLRSLCNCAGIAGEEDSASRCACGLLQEYFPNAQLDAFGNVIAVQEGAADKPILLLNAHIDQIGFVVTHVGEDGFVKIASVGGNDRRLMMAQQLRIFGREELVGVVASKPPHLQLPQEHGKAPDFADLWVDTGLSSGEACRLLEPGDRAVLCSCFEKLLGSRVSSSALDDRAGVAAVLYALELLKGRRLPVRLAVLLSAQEEVGGSGAKIGAYGIQPDYALVADVSFAYHSGCDRHRCGELGKGPMIGIAPTLDRGMSHTLCETARLEGIPFQTEVMNGLTSTDADDIAVCRSGTRVCTVSIPMRYMHTPVECIDLQDVEASGRLMAAYARKLGEGGCDKCGN